MRFLRSPVWWIVFAVGLVLIALLFRSVFGEGTDNSVGASFVGGIIWGVVTVRFGKAYIR
jgi:thiamine transporter ThiT